MPPKKDAKKEEKKEEEAAGEPRVVGPGESWVRRKVARGRPLRARGGGARNDDAPGPAGVGGGGAPTAAGFRAGRAPWR